MTISITVSVILGLIADKILAALISEGVGIIADEILVEKLQNRKTKYAFQLALSETIRRFSLIGSRDEITRPLLESGSPLMDMDVSKELSKVLRFGSEPDYNLIGSHWKAALDNPAALWRDYSNESRLLIDLLKEELRANELFRPVFDSKSLHDINLEARVQTEALLRIEDKLTDLVNITRENLNQVSRKSSKIQSLLYNVPTLPLNYINRPEETELLNLLIEKNRKIGISGMAGVGKTALVISTVQNQVLHSIFVDGIIWLSFGKHTDLVARQIQLAEFLELREYQFKDVQHGKAVLGRLFEGKTCLLILDDVCLREHASAFDCLGGSSCLVITTQDAGIIYGIGAKQFLLRQMNDNDALSILASWSGQNPELLPPQALEIVKSCKGLPLALAAVGSIQQHSPGSWERILHRLQTDELEKIRFQLPGYPFSDLSESIQSGLDNLPEDIRVHYLELALIPRAIAIPENALIAFWGQLGVNSFDTKDMLDIFLQRSLIEKDIANQYTIHDLQRSYLKRITGVSAFEEELKSMGADDYTSRFLAVHLVNAGQEDKLGDALYKIYLHYKDDFSRNLLSEDF